MTTKLLKQLHKLDQLARTRWPTSGGLDWVGLGCLSGSFGASGYEDWCSPTNSQCFACTGGGGVHFSLVRLKAIIDDNSPVIVTLPSEGANSYFVGCNLHDFLCLGCLRGYLCIENINSERYLGAMSDTEFIATEHKDKWRGFGTDDLKEDLLKLMRRELELQPWEHPVEKFNQLQRDYAAKLEYAYDGEEALSASALRRRMKPKLASRSQHD